MVVHELLRWWIIQTNECKSADSVKINISLSFTRYSDGKIIEHQLDDNGIQEVHKIFFDTSLILDILEQQTEQKPSDNDKYLQSLGAFRYMYRCQVKGKHGKVPQMFFHNTNKDEIDKLFLEIHFPMFRAL